MSKLISEVITISTKGRGFYRLDHQLNQKITNLKLNEGVCFLFIPHTSASLVITENADPNVHKDLENFFQRHIPDDLSLYDHIEEGKDDMPAHIRSVLTQTSIHVPILKQQLTLGIWQGIYLWEHRFQAHQRKIIVNIL